ncbi:peptidylprolyl isomerase [Pseudogracilibacillus sp. ICA-222130]|uniref:peptidylprolyl isomerase n=1 Tax=Pseudogracilibacillus sp. ICA-222130 TaxID=3134655 RepID=UPI0030C42BA8
MSGGRIVRKKWLMSLLVVISMLILAACQNDANEEVEKKETEQQQEIGNNEEKEVAKVDDSIKPVVTMTMENGGEVKIELYPSIAPNTVNNFISLVEDGFYDGLIFHRVIPGFMVQGGDPEGNGMGGPGYYIPGEFENNGFENNLAHTRGVLSMARSEDPNSAGSQFFIMTDDAEHLDGEYAAFGEVVEGMDVVDEIVSVERDAGDKPVEDQVIKSMKVDLKGYEPAEVEKQ